MNIELKSIKWSKSLSEETNAFTANVWIDNQLVATAHNQGCGGETNIRPVDKDAMPVIKAAMEYAASLPEVKVEGYDFSYKQTLESIVDDLLYKWICAKEDDRIAKLVQKDMLKGLCITKAGEAGHKLVTWKGFDIPKLLAHPQGKDAITKAIAKHTADGYTILNTNLTGITL